MTARATTSHKGRAPTLLVAEEDAVAWAFLAENLTADGYDVWTADSKEKALAILSVRQPDVVVVDVNGSTLGLIDAIRGGDGLAGHVDPHTPLIVLTARADELHRIRVLDRGSDDVLAKPYSYPELRARLSALLRRARARQAPRVLRAGELTIDLTARTVEVGGTRVELTAKEYELLRTLAREPTRVFTREELLRDVWGYVQLGRTRTLDSPVISSPVWGVGCVDCGFCPSRRRRFISSGVDSALAAVLSPRAKRRGVGAARLSTPPRHRSLSVDFLTYRPSGRVVGWA